MTASGRQNRSSGRERLVLAAVAVAVLAPFLGKPVHVDDPLFLRCAEQVLAHPIDPYGFSVNWFGISLPMADVMRNPPLSCYFLALVGGTVGWSELALHAAFLGVAIVTLLGTYSFAARLCDRPLLAGLLTLSMPAFLLSSTTLMCDPLMLAFLVWSAAIWVAGIESRRLGPLAIACLLALASGLTKYNGFVVLPLLFLYGAARERRLGAWLLPLAGAAALFAIYLFVMNRAYGGSFLQGLSIASGASGPSGARADLAEQVLVGLVFAGGSCLSLLFFAPLVRGWGLAAIALGVFAAGVALLLRVGLPGSPLLQPPPDLSAPATLLQAAILIASAALLIALALRAMLVDRDAGALLLAAWVAATLLLATFASWAVSGRYLLPLAPAASVLLARGLDRARAPAALAGVPRRSGAALAFLPLIPALACALTIALADQRLAESARAAALEISARYAQAGRTIWFQGHWGFQHYMEQQGAQPLDMRSSTVATGDVVVVPENNANTFGMNRNLLEPLDSIEIAPLPWLATQSRPLGAGFYASVWGPLPFVVGTVPKERYEVYLVAPR